MDVEESSAKAGASKPVPVDEGEEDYSEVMNDPEFLQVKCLNDFNLVLGYLILHICFNSFPIF